MTGVMFTQSKATSGRCRRPPWTSDGCESLPRKADSIMEWLSLHKETLATETAIHPCHRRQQHCNQQGLRRGSWAWSASCATCSTSCQRTAQAISTCHHTYSLPPRPDRCALPRRCRGDFPDRSLPLSHHRPGADAESTRCRSVPI